VTIGGVWGTSVMVFVTIKASCNYNSKGIHRSLCKEIWGREVMESTSIF